MRSVNNVLLLKYTAMNISSDQAVAKKPIKAPIRAPDQGLE